MNDRELLGFALAYTLLWIVTLALFAVWSLGCVTPERDCAAICGPLEPQVRSAGRTMDQVSRCLEHCVR